MDKFKRWALRGLMGVAALAAVLVLAIFSASEILLGKTYTPVERQFAVPEGAEADPDIVAEGGRLARIRGCYDGCHGPGGAGGEFFLGMSVPNLTKYVREYSDTGLERSIRQGIRPDGTSLLAMPSASFQYLSDQDLSSIIAFFRSLPEADNDPGPQYFGLRLRGILMFLIYIEDMQIREADRISATDFTVPDDRSNPAAFGRYLAMSICAECHGLALHGLMGAPDLMVASGYSPEEFRQLMATGESADGRDLGLMAAMGRRRFSHLHPEEADAIHAWLTSDEFMMAERE